MLICAAEWVTCICRASAFLALWREFKTCRFYVGKSPDTSVLWGNGHFLMWGRSNENIGEFRISCLPYVGSNTLHFCNSALRNVEDLSSTRDHEWSEQLGRMTSHDSARMVAYGFSRSSTRPSRRCSLASTSLRVRCGVPANDGAESPPASSTLLCGLSTVEGEAYGQSRNHEDLGRDRLGRREQPNQGDTWHRA